MAVVVMSRVSVAPVRVYTPPPAARVSPSASTSASRPIAVQEAPHTNMTPVIVTGAILSGAALHNSQARVTENAEVTTTTEPMVSTPESVSENNGHLGALVCVLILIIVFGIGSRIISKIPNRKKRRMLNTTLLLLLLFVMSIAVAYIYFPK